LCAGHEGFFTHEALCHLSGHISSQDNRMWIADNPRAVCKNPLLLSKIGVWCAVSRK
jgi:hypothetical protein